MIKKIDFETAHRILTEDKESVIIDVREEEEYLTGHAVDALLLPVDTINEETAAETVPTKTTKLIVYCRSGNRSRLAAERLSALGYENIYDVGSLAEWPYGLEYN